MSARNRIRAAAGTLREPRSVKWISEQADSTWSTINEELQNLADQRHLRSRVFDVHCGRALSASFHLNICRKER